MLKKPRLKILVNAPGGIDLQIIWLKISKSLYGGTFILLLIN